MRRLTKLFLVAIIASLALHAAVGFYLGLQAPGGEDNPRDTEDAGPGRRQGPAEGGTVARFIEDPVGMIRRKVDALADVPPETLEDKLTGQADRFKGIVSEGSAKEIQQLVARAGGVQAESGAYEPDPDASGPFDATDFVLHDIRKNVEPDGHANYEIVMVDRDGAVESTVQKSLSPEMHRVYRIFNLVRDQPALRPLVKTAWRIADGMAGSEDVPRSED